MTRWILYSSDIINIISSFLHCKDAIKLCYLNKSFYAIFLKSVIQYSFVSINTDKIININNSNLFNTMNLYIDGLKKVKEPIFLYIERSIKNAIQLEEKWINLRYISFGKSFNYRIDALPSNIEEIVFHPKSVFNQKITNLNCNKLKRIFFGKSFNQRIDFLPSSIEIIHFHETSKFDKPIQKIPFALKEIYFGQWFNRSIDALWNRYRLRRLQFASRSVFMYEIKPSKFLEILSIGMYYNQSLNLENTEITSLRFHKLSRYNKPLQLPKTLVFLSFGEFFNQEIQLHNVQILRFYAKSRFNQSIFIPESCHTLILGRYFNNDILGCRNIRLLKFSKNSKYDKWKRLAELSKKNIELIHPEW
jgi:hypothetical protein